MTRAVSDFTIAQLQTFTAYEGRLHPAGLRSRIDALDTGEVIAVYRPRDPNEWPWFVSPAEGGRVLITALPSGAERELQSIASALDWIAAAELGDAPDPMAYA